MILLLPKPYKKNTLRRTNSFLLCAFSHSPLTSCRAFFDRPLRALSPTSLSRHENTFALDFECRMLHGLHPPRSRTHRSARHAPPRCHRHCHRIYHTHGQRIRSRQFFRGKWYPDSFAPHFSPPTHRPRLPTPAPIGTRSRPSATSAALGRALCRFPLRRSDKTMAVARLRCRSGHRCRKTRVEKVNIATFSRTRFRTSIYFSKRCDAKRT